MTLFTLDIKRKKKSENGFTLIELMIVMLIVGLLTAMVGPFAINSLEKAQAKQEMLSMKNWLRKISYRAFSTGRSYTVKLSGKEIALYDDNDLQSVLVNKTFESLFFQPQNLTYNKKGFVTPNILIGTYRGKSLSVNLAQWVNGEIFTDDI